LNGIRERARLMALFAWGALVPAAGLLLPVALVAAPLAGGGRGVTGLTLALLGAGLLVLGGQGLVLGFRSWPSPPGRQVTEAEAPELHARLEAVRASWRGPRTGAVLLDPHAWGQDLLGTPTLGLLGWARFHWLIGIYPLAGLSTREWEALLSWEVVWWSDQQGWLNLQVKRLVAYWQMVYGQLHEAKPGWMTRWGAGFMRPYSKFMVRRMEGFLVRECLWTDAHIARQHGHATFARALCRLALVRPLVDRRFFPAIEARLRAGEPVPEDLYAFLAEVLGAVPAFQEGLLDLALDGLEPHAPPLLKVRLEKLGVEPVVPMPAAKPALGHLLEGTGVMAEFQAALTGLIRTHQIEKARRKREGDARFEALGPMVTGWFPHHPHAMEYVNLAFDRTSPGVFRILLEAARTAHPRHPDGRILGLRLLLREGRAALAEAEAAAILAQNPFLAPVCHRLLGQHHREQGDLGASERELNLACRAEAMLDRARKERRGASLSDPLEPHGCLEAQLQPMVTYLKALGGLDQAFLVRKKLAVHPDHPVLLLVVSPRGGWWDPRGRRRHAFQARIARECPFPGRATGYVLVARPALLWRHRRLFDALGALIHPGRDAQGLA